MSHEALNAKEREALLRSAGLPPELIEKVEHATPDTVAETVQWFHSTPESETLLVEERKEVAAIEAQALDVDQVMVRILSKAAGSQDHALKAVDTFVQDEFNRIKLSKIQAAAQGVDKVVHNKNAWAHCQTLREALKTKVRAEFRTNSGFVKSKVNKASKQKNADLDAFMLANQDNDVLRQFLALQGGA